MKKRELTILQSKIGDLIPYPNNARTHEEKQVDRIAASISEFGFNAPIVIDEDRIVLVGHGRLLAAKKLKLTDVPTIQITDLTPAQKKAYRIIDNKLTDDSDWDMTKLYQDTEFLSEEGFDIELFGLIEFTPDPEPFENPEDEAQEPKLKRCPKCGYDLSKGKNHDN